MRQYQCNLSEIAESGELCLHCGLRAARRVRNRANQHHVPCTHRSMSPQRQCICANKHFSANTTMMKVRRQKRTDAQFFAEVGRPKLVCAQIDSGDKVCGRHDQDGAEHVGEQGCDLDAACDLRDRREGACDKRERHSATTNRSTISAYHTKRTYFSPFFHVAASTGSYRA